MLALVTSDKCYVNNLLEKLIYTKEKSPKMTNLYKCMYNNHEFIILVTGYGKVNIGSSLRCLSDKYNIKAVISIGTGGSTTDTNDIFRAVIPTSTLEFDVDFMPNGYKPAQVPLIDKAIYKTNDDLNNCLKNACIKRNINYSYDVIATSDMFVSNYNLSNSIRREYNAGLVDTEAGSIGEYCYINDIPYSCLKVVSNFASNNAIKQYNLYDDNASNIMQNIMYKFLKLFYKE